ncbi:hypothetical protein KR51_00031740 [Rubidibacter lacunae KORDI 51-2]|uniref:MFS transporter n=1 Tax=Rubidibacter lacunae KORDI 51-2 TaxID=582515 RepID=U5DHZ6_9CHRO|nr:MFS transporter [Rubidibacter lacunae]ERN40234.1 hypothetical protein KR51_00031740 [Rubidibacter lacunae KORDI 51-2]
MTQSAMHWRRLSGIVAVQGSISLGWVIYVLYLPDLLVRLGFPQELAGVLILLEHALEAIVQPLFGHLADRSERERGTRFPWIISGVVLASACFLAIPAIALFLSPASPWRWMLPATAVLWASAMAVFRSPVVALLARAAPKPQLPIAASCLTLIQQCINAIRFSAFGFILGIGPLFTFATGTFVLLGAATLLRRVTPVPASPAPVRNEPAPAISVPAIVAIIGTGIGLCWGVRFLFAGLTQTVALRFSEASGDWALLGFNVLVALTALPAGWVASQIGNTRAMAIATIATALLLGIVSSNAPMAIFLVSAAVMSFTLSTVLNGMVPFVLELVPESRASLGVGTFFGAFSGAIVFFELAFARFQGPDAGMLPGMTVLTIASGFIALGWWQLRQRDRQFP